MELGEIGLPGVREREIAEHVYKQTGGRGPRWQLQLDYLHTLAILEDGERARLPKLPAHMRNLDTFCRFVGPKHSLSLARVRVEQAEAMLRTAQGELDAELWLWRQFREHGIGAAGEPLAS
jgi:hypothetical protein